MSDEIKVKGSRFIGYVRSAESIETAEKFINKISGRNYNATHNCTAYRVGYGDSSVYRYNDDGEPSGTAGKQILEAVDGRNLTNVVCVVTRYFGGIKLGTGGLARAYRECAGRTLDKGRVKKIFQTEFLTIIFKYEKTGIIMNLIEKSGCSIIKKKYGKQTALTLEVRKSQIENFKINLINQTAGDVILKEEK